MDILVGYTGFVGSNLCEQHEFNLLLNSRNIADAFGLAPDFCVYAGVWAEKDFALILNAIENIKRTNPKQLVLISTIDVYKNPVNVSETSIIETDGLNPYGLNRYRLEQWVRENIENHLIVRLLALFGKNIKKKFIYDLINVIPSKLTETKFCELSEKHTLITESYTRQDNVLFDVVPMDENHRKELKTVFKTIGFSALNFTDSRAVLQFYNLACLWGHIQIALSNNVRFISLATEASSKRIAIARRYKT